jgi:Protein of unknown function (DUF3800)
VLVRANIYLPNPSCDARLVRGETERLADAVIPRPNRGKYLATLAVYGDESGSARVFVLSVYIAQVERWATLETDWKTILEKAGMRDGEGKLLPFHMADFESRIKPFDTWEDDKRKNVLGALIETIHAADAYGFSVALPMVQYQKLNINSHLPMDHKLHRVMQYMICFYSLHVPLMKLAETLRLPEPIPVVMDRNNVTAGMVQSVMDQFYENDQEISKFIDTPVFRDKSIFIPIQAADILAYESMKHRDNQILSSGRRVRTSYDLLLGDRRRHKSLDYDEENAPRLIAMMREGMAELGFILQEPPPNAE